MRPMIEPPKRPANSFRIILDLPVAQRIDSILLAELRKQERSPQLKGISRAAFKELFKKKRIQLKGQPARPSSHLAVGITYVDILGFEDAES